MASLSQTVLQEIEHARTRVYQLYEPTPLEPLRLGLNADVWVKREDLSPIHSYKWRGAFNCISQMKNEELKNGIVAASAGNHAQGVAVTAKKLGLAATIFMPETVPKTKYRSVLELGAQNVRVILTGRSYDEAFAAAENYSASENAPLIHAYDDARVMGGQGTLASEVASQAKDQRFDRAYLQIGGGGLAAAVGLYLKATYPEIRLIGVEAQGQASMHAALKAGHPTRLNELDHFCDGTSVRQTGKLSFELCRNLLDDLVLVSNEEVCQAIRLCWETRRLLPEPSGALGLAGLLKQRDVLNGERTLVILTGANMDLSQIAHVLQNASTPALQWSNAVPNVY